MKKTLLILLILLHGILIIKAQPGLGNIHGSIQNTRQEPLAGIYVQLSDTKFAAITDEDGGFTMRNIPAGKYTLVITGIGYKVSKENIMVTAGSITAVDLQLNEITKELAPVTVKANGVKRYLESVSTSGTRLPLGLVETPQTIQVITNQVIKDQQAQNLNDVTKNMTGVVTNAMYTSYTMRGFLNSYNNQFITYDGQIGNMYWWNQMVQLYNIDRVEEIAGPASALFSTGSPGGVINMVTKKPLNKFSSSFNLTTGSWGLADVSADLGGPLTKNGKLLYRLNIGFNNQNSYRPFQYNTNLVIAPSLTYNISSKTNITLDYIQANNQARYGEDHGGLVLMKPDSTYDWKNLNVKFSFGSPRDYSEIYNTNVTLKVNHQFSQNLKVTYMSRFLYQHLNSGEIYGYYWGDNYFTALPDSMVRGYNTWAYKNYNFQNSIFSTIDIRGKVVQQTLVIGADYQRYGDWKNRYISGAAPGISFARPDYSNDNFNFPIDANTNVWDVRSTNRQLGVYVQDLISIGNHFKVLAAARFDNFKFTIRPNSSDTYVTNDTSDAHVFLPRVGVVYSFNKNQSVYASYCQSFLPQYDNMPASGGPFPPQKGKQYEAGYKGLFFGGRLLSSIAVYSIKLVNVLATDPTDPSGVRQIVVPGLTSMGAELTLQGKINSQLHVIAGYAFNNVNFSENSPLGPKGGRYDNAPKNVANFWIKYTVPGKSPLKALSFSVGGKYVGNRVGIATNQHFVLPAYFIVDAAVNYNISRFSIGLNAYNLADKKYAVGYYSSDLMVQVGAPFNWKLSVRYSIN